jgi:hypothetical protein
MTMVQVSKNFRKADQPTVVIGENGKPFPMYLCQELVDGRWEPFFSVLPLQEKSK